MLDAKYNIFTAVLRLILEDFCRKKLMIFLLLEIVDKKNYFLEYNKPFKGRRNN